MEFEHISMVAPTPVELVGSELLYSAVLQGAQKAIPEPTEPVPFSVNIPMGNVQNDPEYTAALATTH